MNSRDKCKLAYCRVISCTCTN